VKLHGTSSSLTENEIEAYLTELGYKLRNMVSGDPIFPGRETAHSACFSMHAATLSLAGL
jgi:hypothetical protein